MKIDIIVDSPDSWFVEHGQRLCELLQNGHDAKFSTRLEREGDIAFFLSCGNIYKSDQLRLHKNNIVIHAGDLPREKGWSPMVWRILEGKNEVILSLFEAVERVDSGKIYMKDKVMYRGDELLPELRQKLADKILAMAIAYVNSYPMQGSVQKGESSYYRRRNPNDSELDIEKTITEQFNLMRVADNENYPLFFWRDGQKYVLKVYKA